MIFMDDLDEQLRVLKWQIRVKQRELALIKRNKEGIQLPDLLREILTEAWDESQKELKKMCRLWYTKQYQAESDNKARRNAQLKIRRHSDQMFKFRINVRGRIRACLKRNGLMKSQKTIEIIGCDFHFLKNWIEGQFQDGMTWANMGQWHIDHKKPLISGKTEKEILALCHYTNLQPLWAIDNLMKGTRY
jgi:hypothetical protein